MSWMHRSWIQMSRIHRSGYKCGRMKKVNVTREKHITVY
uniref:Uncharacterized protein n=1 Tax=Lepeophtheirus salmonis TaxID=72036 RepID=A0A0K2TFK0_LEPSM